MKPHVSESSPKDRSSPDIVVFWIVRDSACAECGEAQGKGRFLRMEGERALCLGCADLDHLVFLARGDVALTRRASKYSTLRAVVLRFSRSRKRYERQGILVEERALERAEQECLSDAEARRLGRTALRNGDRNSIPRTCRSSQDVSVSCSPDVHRTNKT